MFRTVVGLCALFTAAGVAPALAQGAPSPSPSPTAAPSEIGRVSTSDRHDEPLRNVVKSTYVVTKAEMVARGDITVADALDRVPGVNVQRAGPIGSESDVTIDGYRTSQILILIDGRPVPGEQIELTALGTIPTTGVERIEVVEGGGATLYGTGALGGVINIITTGGAGLQRHPRVSLDAGSLGERGFTFENGTFSFERRVSSNAYSFPAVGPVPAGTSVNDDYETTSARFAKQLRAGALRIGVDAGLAENHVGDPGDFAFPPLSTTARENMTAGDGRVTLALDRAQSTTTLDLSGTSRTFLYTFSPDDPAYAAGNIFGGTTQVETEGRVQASLRDVIESRTSTLVAGIDLAHGAGRVDDGLHPASLPFAQTAAYAQETLVAPDGIRTELGLRGERDGAYGGIVAPSLGVRIPLGAALDLRANAATGFRAPDLTELIYPTYSNPNLRPERSKSTDVALDAPALLGGASLRWFSENGNDLIAINSNYDYGAATSPANPYLINVARYAIAGFVGSIRTQAFHGISSSLSLTDTYRALDLTSLAARLARRPVLAGDLTLEYGSPRGLLDGAGFLAHAVGPHDTPDTEFTRVDAYVRLRAAPSALVSLRVFNLGNERYADVSGFPMPGRTFALELSTR